MNETFRKFASTISRWAGSAWAFILALLVLAGWVVSGPLFKFSDTWQLAINTGTTIVTFLMVFLIQNTQNREAKAINLKLDELIHAMKEARDNMVDLEDATDDELESLEHQFQRLRARVNRKKG